MVLAIIGSCTNGNLFRYWGKKDISVPTNFLMPALLCYSLILEILPVVIKTTIFLQDINDFTVVNNLYAKGKKVHQKTKIKILAIII